jgi:hypothetical protein
MIDCDNFVLHTKKSGQVIKKFHCTCDKCGIDRGYQSKSKAKRLCRSCTIAQPEYRNKLSKSIKNSRSSALSREKTKIQMAKQHEATRIKNKFFKIIKKLIPDWWKTDRWRTNISNAQKGKIPYNKGKCISLEQKIKQSCKHQCISVDKFSGFVVDSIQYRLRHNLRSRLSLITKKTIKHGSAVKDLGCTIQELKLYLESKFLPGMTWENYGLHGWHIDHVAPLSSFDLTNPEELKKACHYSNLQPLWAKDNIRKSNKQ